MLLSGLSHSGASVQIWADLGVQMGAIPTAGLHP